MPKSLWVAPRPGRADRNTYNEISRRYVDESRPARGVRIETAYPNLWRYRAGSRPARGVRIETTPATDSPGSKKSRPARGVRIETMPAGKRQGPWWVAPRPGRADRNKEAALAQVFLVCRAPPGACG